MFDVTLPMQTYTTDRVLRELATDIEAKVLIPEAITENVSDLVDTKLLCCPLYRRGHVTSRGV